MNLLENQTMSISLTQSAAERVRSRLAVRGRGLGLRLGVKASGGIRTADAALAMLDAGATRLGLSGTRAVLDGLG